MRRLLLLLALCLPLGAQAPVFSGIVVDGITYSGARVSWDTDINTITLSGVAWDTQPTPPLAFTQYRKTPGNGGNSFVHGKTLSGLPAGTTIYYQVYGTNPADSVAYYSAVGSFDTLPAPADRLADPPLPTEYRASPPSSYALDVTAPDCTTAFASAATVNSIKWAAAQGVTGNVVVRLDYTDPSFQSPGCVASATTWAFPANTNTGWLQVRSSAPDLMLPPPGVRIRDEWRPGMVRLLNAWWQIEKQTAFTGDSANRLYLGPGLYFAESWPPPSSVFRTVTAIGTGVDPSVTVSDAAGWSDGQLVQIGDIAGMDKDHIYNCKIQGLSGNTFVAHGCTISGTYGGGAWVINSTGFSIPHITRHFSSNATDLVIDRCIFTVEHAPPTGQDSEVNLTGAENVHVRDSIFTGAPVWRGVDPDTGNTTSTFSNVHVAIDFSACVGCTVENTYTNSPGITYFSQAGNGSRSAKDLVFRRNYLDWDNRWLTRDASAIGLYAHTRQQFETKSADTMLFEGNRIRHGWSSSDAGSNSNAVWVIAAANDGGPDKDSVNVARNHTYRFNTISESHGGFGFRGKHYYQDDTLYGGHYLFHDNLISNLDGRRWKRNAGDVQSANPFTWADAMEGVIIRHNTIHNSRGSYPVVVLFNGGDPGSDFRFRDNLLTSVNRDSSRGGINSTAFVGDSLQTIQHYTTPNGGVLDMGGNVVTAGVLASNLDSNYDLTSGGSYYSQTLCDTDWSTVGGACIGATGESANTRLARIKYFDGFRLRNDSEAVGGASDGRDAGADIDKLEAAQGLVRNSRVINIGTTTATIAYTRPGDAACTVEVSTSATWGTGTRTVDAGAILDQTAYVPVIVDLTGLTGGTLYYYRVLCPVEQPTGTFTTGAGL